MKVSAEYLRYIVQQYLLNKLEKDSPFLQDESLYDFTLTQKQNKYKISFNNPDLTEFLASHLSTDFDLTSISRNTDVEVDIETANLLCENVNDLSIQIYPSTNPEFALEAAPEKIVLFLNKGESLFKFYYPIDKKDMMPLIFSDLNISFIPEIKDNSYVMWVTIDLEKTPTIDSFLERITRRRTMQFH